MTGKICILHDAYDRLLLLDYVIAVRDQSRGSPM
jgi:hypothetical protein